MESTESAGRGRLVSFIQAQTTNMCDARLYVETSKQVPQSGLLPKRCIFYYLRTYASAPQCNSAVALCVNLLSAECESKSEHIGALSGSSQLQTGAGSVRSCALFALCAACAACDTTEARRLCSRTLLDALHDQSGSVRQSAALAVHFFDATLRNTSLSHGQLQARPNDTTRPAEPNGDADEPMFAELFGRSGIVDRLYSLIRDADMNIAVCAFEVLAKLLGQPNAGRIVITHSMIRHLLDKRLNDISDWQLATVFKVLASSDAYLRMIRLVSVMGKKSNESVESSSTRPSANVGSPERLKDLETVNFLKEVLRTVIARRCTANLFDCVIDKRLRRAKLTLLRVACDLLVELTSGRRLGHSPAADESELDGSDTCMDAQAHPLELLELNDVYTAVQRVAECALLYFMSHESTLLADENELLAAFLNWCVRTISFNPSCQLSAANKRLAPQLIDSNELRIAKLRVITSLLAATWRSTIKPKSTSSSSTDELEKQNIEQLKAIFENLKLFLYDKSIAHLIVEIVIRDWLSALQRTRAAAASSSRKDANEGELIAGLSAADTTRRDFPITSEIDPILSTFDSFLYVASQFAEDEIESTAEHRLLLVFLGHYPDIRVLPTVRDSVIALVRTASESDACLLGASDQLLMGITRILTDYATDFVGATYIFERVLHSITASTCQSQSHSLNGISRVSACVSTAILRCAVVLFTHEPAEMQSLLGESLEAFAPIIPHRVRFYYGLLRQLAYFSSKTMNVERNCQTDSHEASPVECATNADRKSEQVAALSFAALRRMLLSEVLQNL